MKCTRCGVSLVSGSAACVSCGATALAEPTDELKPGTRIGGKYEIVSTMGTGGMGRVYRAVQTSLNSAVCIKTLHAGALADPSFAARFEREARATSRLRHPNIVSVFDFGTDISGQMYLVMELVEGMTLADVAKKGVLSARRAVRILGQVCDALSFAHAHGIVHRDLKPANVMVFNLPTENDIVKVLDFGSALMLESGEEGEKLTRVGSVIGTPAYIAPEYLLGKGADARVDVYAVGTLLYRLLTGTTPFRGNAQSMYAQQVTMAPEPPRKRNPKADVSEAMERVILKALIKDPSKRFASALEFKEAMEHALDGFGFDHGTGLEIEIDDVEPHAVEIAHEERSVAILSIRSESQSSIASTAPFERIASVARTHGGVVETLADGLQLVFGLDREVPEAAADAMHCAIDLAALPLSPALQIGLRDGQASCRGRFGDPGFHHTLFGPGAGVAWQLCAHAQPGFALVAGPLARHVPSTLGITPVPPPRDFYEPVFALTDPSHADVRQGELAFVGRTEEQRLLLELAVESKSGRICLLKGPDGIGKSRLVRELTSQVARLGVLWTIVAPTGDSNVGPSHPVSVLSALGFSASSGSASTTERYAIEVMLGRDDSREDSLSGERKQLRLVSAALEGIARRLEHTPLVIVLDDLDQADDLTRALTQRLVEMSRDLKVGVVLCMRDDIDLDFQLPDGTLRISLGPLKPQEVQPLALPAVSASLDPQVLSRIVRDSRGIPLLIEETIRAITQGDELLTRDIGQLSVEDALGRLIQARCDALNRPARSILHAAAILGVEPRQEEVVRLVSLHDPSTQNAIDGLADLRAQGLLLVTAMRTVRFPSAATRAVVLSGLSQSVRRALHAQAAELVASCGDSRRTGEVAEHLADSEQWDRAFGELRKAAEIAQAGGAVGRAIHLLQRAQQVGGRLGQNRATERAAVARQLGRLFMERGALVDAERVFREATTDARAGTQADLAADLLRLHGRVLMLEGNVADGQREIESACHFAERRNFNVIAAEAYVDLADAADVHNSASEAVGFLERALRLVEGREDHEAASVRIQLYNRLGRRELQAGNITAAIALFTQALSLAERVQDRHQAAGLLGNLGGAYAKQKELDRAVHFTERALRSAESLGDQIGLSRQSFNLALLRLAVGHREPAKQLLRRSYDAARSAGWREGLAMSSAALNKLLA